MTLVEHVEHYVTFRRALGHVFVQQVRCLRDYATYAEARGDSFVRSSTVLEWASTTPSPRQAQAKLRLCVRSCQRLARRRRTSRGT